jgi:transcriptional regulator with XRE-family HTH domain
VSFHTESAVFPQVEEPQLFAIGATLREARQRRGLSLDDVQQSLHFRVRYLTALEEEHWDLLPGEAYTKGFLRTYADFLGLDGTLFIDEFNERIAGEEEQSIVPESLAPRRRRSRVLIRTIVGVFAIAFVVFAAAAGRPSSSPATHVDAAAAATPKPAVQRGMPVAPVVLPAHPTPVAALIRATKARSWLSVRVGGPDGKELFRGFLNRGHELSYPLGSNVWVRIGRPHAVVVTLGRRTVKGLPGTPANLLLTRYGPQAG